MLVGPDEDPLAWGCYPMVPFAGRVRHGRFAFDGVDYELPINLDAHAIHGYGFTSEWTVSDEQTLTWELRSPWPFPGGVVQSFALFDDRLTLSMTLHAEARQPVTMGWHPWFRRDIGAGAPVRLDFQAARMYELDGESIPTGQLIDPPAGPWDNCFTDLSKGPKLRWGDALTLDLTSTADYWVIYDEPVDAICVEPQTGPPDAFNRSPAVIDAGESASIEMNLIWR